MRIVPIGVDERGEIDIEELKAKATEHKDKCVPSSLPFTRPPCTAERSMHAVLRGYGAVIRGSGRPQGGVPRSACCCWCTPVSVVQSLQSPGSRMSSDERKCPLPALRRQR
jgi:hypothetical protein